MLVWFLCGALAMLPEDAAACKTRARRGAPPGISWPGGRARVTLRRTRGAKAAPRRQEVRALTLIITLIIDHFVSIAGFLLAVVLLTKVFREARRPGGPIAWVLAIVLIPYVAVPLYLLIGGRKVRQMAEQKSSLFARGYGCDTARTEPRTQAERVLTAAQMPPARAGNEVALLHSGETAYAEMMTLLESAERSIHVTTFILGRDAVGRAIVELLARKAAEGVEVRLLLDSLGCFLTRGRFTDPLRRAGGKVGVFMPVLPLRRRSSANLRNHRKMIIVDGAAAMVGGMNLSNAYMGPEPCPARFFDTAAIVRGPAVADIQAVFIGDWHYATNEALESPFAPPSAEAGDVDGGVVQVVASGPDVPEDVYHDAVLTAAMHAEERIWIATPYFVPDEAILKALSLQARMGRDVRLLVPARSNHVIPDYARGPFLRRLQEMGAKVYAYPRMVHAKMLLFDDRIAVTGSPNLDMRSMYLNYEIALFHYSPREIAETEGWLAARFEEAELQPLRKVGLTREWAENLSIMVSPLL